MPASQRQLQQPEENPRIGDFILRWERIVANRDMQGLFDLLAPDVQFYSPAVFKPYQGREAVTFLLAHVIEVFGDLAYTHHYHNDQGGVVMQFQTSVEAADGSGRRLTLEGVDIFQLNERGQVQEMRVLIRPLFGLQALAAAMQSRVVGVVG